MLKEKEAAFLREMVRSGLITEEKAKEFLSVPAEVKCLKAEEGLKKALNHIVDEGLRKLRKEWEETLYGGPL